MDARGLLRVMAYHNAWANVRLLSACERLSQAEFVAPRIGFFPSLRATLTHNLTVDWFYVDAMEGGSLGLAAFAQPVPCQTAPALLAAQRAMDGRLIAVVERLDAADVVRVERGTRVQMERFDRLALHVFQHQIHHRGQAHAMLSATSVAPPQLDEFFCAGEEGLRASEFAALGWSETDIWRERVIG